MHSHRKITDEQKAEIVHIQVSGIRKHQIIDSMLKWHSGYDKVGFTVRDLYNFCYRNKLQMLSAGDAQTIMNYLIAQKHRDPDLYFDHKREGESI
jgi:zinc finger SWIM domain-containing protein 3